MTTRGARHTLLPAGTLGLGGKANTAETVEGLELLHRLGRVVDEGEAGGLATTELGAQTEDGDLVLLSLVQATDLLAELLLGDVGTVGVQDVTIRILGQQTVLQSSTTVPFHLPSRRPSPPSNAHSNS